MDQDEFAHHVGAAVREMQRVRFERASKGAQATTVPGGKRLTCNPDMGPAEVRQF